MIVIDYQKKHHKKIIHACVLALKQGRVVAYPTDTSYGLAVDATNKKALRKLYQIKGRDFKKPSSFVVPSLSYAKKNSLWEKSVNKLVKKFWPGALTIVLKTKNKAFIAWRMPDNKIAMDLAKILHKPITATSGNVSGQPDCYSADDIIKQFKNKKLKPDIIINAGRLPKRKPSTIVKITTSSPRPNALGGQASLKRRGENTVEILRQGPISATKIAKALC